MTNQTKPPVNNPPADDESNAPSTAPQDPGPSVPSTTPPPAPRAARKPKTQAEFRALSVGDMEDDPKFNLDELAAYTKYQLSLEPQVTKFIPLDIGEKRGTVQPFTINGYRIRILKGREVSVPVSMAALIDNFLNNTVQEDSPYNLENEEAMNTKKDGVYRREAFGR